MITGRRAVRTALVLVLAAACTDGGGPASPRVPSRLELQFGDSLIELGTQRQVFSLVRAADGTTIYDIQYRWRSSDTTVVRVEARGVVRAVGLGRAEVRAEVRRDTAASAPPLVASQIFAVVTPRVVRRVIIDRDTVTIAQAGTVTLIGTPEADDRTPLPERPVAWRSEAPAIATVSPSGIVTGLAPGVAPIIVSVAGFADTAFVRVSTLVGGVDAITIAPLPDTIRLGSRWPIAATVRDADGHVLTDRVISWSLSTLRGIDVGFQPSPDSLVGARRGVLALTASSEGRRVTREVVVDEAFDAFVAPNILRPLDLPAQTFDDTVRVLVTSNTAAPLERVEFFLDYRPVAVQETVLPGRAAVRAWTATIKLDAWPFGPLRFEAIGTTATGVRGVRALVFLRIPAEPQGGPLQGGGRR